MNFRNLFEEIVLKKSVGLTSRFRRFLYFFLGMKMGENNRFEVGRCRRLTQIEIGSNNAFTSGFMLWPLDAEGMETRIKIGNDNYFNRNVMIDACGIIEIGNFNMIGPDVYITDSNHRFGENLTPSNEPMNIGRVKIGDHCWVGAKSIILKDVELGDRCVVGAGAVVTRSFPAGSVIAGIPAKLIK